MFSVHIEQVETHTPLYGPFVSTAPGSRFTAALTHHSPKKTFWIYRMYVHQRRLVYHILLVAVDFLRVCDAILSELQDHLGTFFNSLVISLTAGQEVWVLFLKVWVAENHRLCSGWWETKSAKYLLAIQLYKSTQCAY